MREIQSFQQDCIELAVGRFRRGEIDRRTLLRGLVALGVAPAVFAAGSARAADAEEIVLANWGGLANDAYGRCYGQPFEKDHSGVEVVMDGSGPTGGRIRAMVDSGHVTWDLCDSSANSAYWLGGLGLLDKIDYSIVDKENLPPKGFATPYGAAPYSFSSVLAYDRTKFGDNPPQSWADFWDLEKFPGTRLLRKDAVGVLEAAVMASGAPMDKIYPLDVDLALEKIEEIKDHLIYWSSGAESAQIMRTGEAVMGQIWSTRASVLSRESDDQVTWTWNQGVIQPGMFVIPKGNPSGKLAHQLLASMTAKVEPQVELLGILGNGPTNPKAVAAVPADQRRYNPTDPDNMKVQLIFDGEWWGKGETYPDVNSQYNDVIAS